MRIVLTSLVIALAVARLSPAASPPGSEAELKCQTAMSKGVAKLIGSQVKCVARCRVLARKGLVPSADCAPPYGGATAACLHDPVKGAAVKAVLSIQKGCAGGCPVCYAGGDCSAAVPARVTAVLAEVDALLQDVWCDDGGSPDGLTASEAKRQDLVAKTFAKYATSTAKCFDKCVASEFGQQLPPGSCEVFGWGPATCLNAANGKAISALDPGDFDAVAECHGALGLTFGFDWLFQRFYFSRLEEPDETYCTTTTTTTTTSSSSTTTSTTLPCTGSSLLDACWYASAPNESCATACAGLGRVYDEATRTVAGSQGSDEACGLLHIILGFPDAGFLAQPFTGAGCWHLPGTGAVRDTQATTAEAVVPGPRICACR